jgi:hypothetical protein
VIPHPSTEDVSQVVETGRRNRRVGSVLWLAGVLLGGIIMGALVASLWSLATQVEKQASDVAALRAQLVALGVAPDESTDPAVVTSGLDGRAGERGADGEDGAPGKDGRNGAPGEDGKDGTPGVNGNNGLNGGDGADGLNGVSVVGPQGADGPPGLDGAQGPQGEPGPQGDIGPQGEQGFPGFDGAPPVGWWIDGQFCSDPDGDLIYECTEVAP